MSDPKQIEYMEATHPELIRKLVTVTQGWHERALAEAGHMLQIPEGTEVEIGDNEKGTSEILKLTGEAHKAFLLGLTMAANLFVELPFTTMTQEEADELQQSQSTVH